jgi:molybdenum cofactor synthesis domain-containing protein
MEGIVKAICISKKKGTAKYPVSEAEFVVDHGILGDAHAGKWHRQVSLLSYDKVIAFNERGGNAGTGDFGENLLVEGIDFASLPVGTIFTCGDVVLKMTQIGKECHTHCQIYHRVGDCIMPREGIFAEVLHGGVIRKGDVIHVTEEENPKLTAAVITLSDQGSKGLRKDLSGPKVQELLESAGYEVIEYLLLPDEQLLIEKELKRLADQRQVNVILTTGGTGFSKRDVTPEATLNVMTRNAPGISEAIRYESMKYTRRAMLSRGASVIRNQTLIVNLPGSVKAVTESMEIILDSMEHGIRILTGKEKECGRHD